MARSFRALGTYVHLATRDPAREDAAVSIARQVLSDVDRTCSRFRDDSDLTLANAHAGRWTEVDPLLALAVSVALEVAAGTDGLVHPLLGRPMLQWGYDRTFNTLTDPTPLPLTCPPLESWREVGVDLAGAVRVPADTALDLGATAKALAADLIASEWSRAGIGAALVSLGGDLTISDPDDDPWTVAVSTRPGGPVEQEVDLWSGGLATSSTQVRRWIAGGVQRHHVLDPRTGAPADTPWATVTATGTGAVAANAATTAALVLGDDAPAWLTAHHVDARLVTTDGRVDVTGAWPTPTLLAEKETA